MAQSDSSLTREHTLKSFWVVLEFRLSGALYNSDDPNFEDFVCEGIFLPSADPQFESENITQNRKIELKTWFGTSGEELYDATIRFGPKAMQLFASNQPLENSIPDYGSNARWFDIDTRLKTIDIHLQ